MTEGLPVTSTTVARVRTFNHAEIACNVYVAYYIRASLIKPKSTLIMTD